VRRVSADVPANPHSAKYLATKRTKLGHLFNSAAGLLIAGNHSVRGTSMLDLGDAAGAPVFPHCICSRHRIARDDIELTIPRQLPALVGLRYVLQAMSAR
jgi:hypothetical protein